MNQSIGKAFETFNAKQMTASQVGESFVEHPALRAIASSDHCYLIGPRGSGKTTLLRMLHGESLMAWSTPNSQEIRSSIDFASIFLPADELWSSQTTKESSRAVFTVQLLYAFLESISYRAGWSADSIRDIHLPVQLDYEAEVEFCVQCIGLWGLPSNTAPSIVAIQSKLDLMLAEISNEPFELSDNLQRVRTSDSLNLLALGTKAFNRAVKEPSRKWALLLDEMELAPKSIHSEVVNWVRGGNHGIILKLSMSPFDRYIDYLGMEGGPIPGHDFQPIYLTSLTRTEVKKFTSGLWSAALKDRGLPPQGMVATLGESAITLDRRASPDLVRRVLSQAQRNDPTFAKWMRSRTFDLNNVDLLTYNQKSATVRKVYPLLVFRDATLIYKNGRLSRRSRKKSLEPFTGATAVTTALEGNPRWIKTAFASMLGNVSSSASFRVSPGTQFDALSSLAARFESLLSVLPTRTNTASVMPVPAMVEAISKHFNRKSLSDFTPDPQGCFTIEKSTPEPILDSLVLGLYAGAFVHVRDSNSPAVLSSFTNQRFRLAYLLGVRDQKEFPLRLGKDASLTSILRESPSPKSDSGQLGFNLED